MHDLVTIAEQLEAILIAREAELQLEQAVHGIDHGDELELQALLASGLAVNHRVTREAFYPSAVGKKSHRPRCDLVLGDVGADALWLELKVAHQLRPSGRRNARYGHQWRRAIVKDLAKMRADPQILHAALGLVVFNDSLATLEKDLALFETLLGEGGLFGFRVVRSVPITERIGHAYCSVALWPLLS
jgi:hypothetical protein